MIGETILHYRIVEKLGAGGMGDVYRARDTKLNRDVALKVLPAEVATDVARLDRFRREAQSLAALDHPGIVTVFSVEEADGFHFLTMQLVPGRSLDGAIPASGMPLEDILRIGAQLAEALAAAHETGIVHRDLKPANVMVTDDNRVKVVDFGLARALHPTGPEERTRPAQDLTVPGQVMGTPVYMSPEQVMGRPVDHRSDLFSLGIILYEMACGRRPFEGESVAELTSAILRDTPKALQEIRRDLPSELARIVQRCLEKDAPHRIQMARDVANELRELAPAQRRTKPRTMAPSVETSRIAVLPFVNHSPGPDQEWFAAGTHEALLTALQQIHSMRVISRSSSTRYTETTKLLPEIAAELQVMWLVEGSATVAGDRVRITAQLVDGVADQQVWSHQYDRDVQDLLALQSEVAQAIATEVHAVITPDEAKQLAQAPRVNPAAYRAYVLGLHHFDRATPADFRRCVSFFDEAIEIDPALASAHASLAVAYGIALEYGWVPRTEGEPVAERAALTARELAPDSIDAWHAVATVEFHVRRDYASAERSCRKALTLGSDAYVHFTLGWLLSQLGRHDEAVTSLESSVELDPKSPLMHSDLGWWLYGARRFERAIVQAHTAMELDPDFPEAHWLLAAAHAARGEFERSLPAFARYEELYGEPRPWFRGYLLGLANRREEALHDLAALEKSVAAGTSPGIDRAQIHLGLGDLDSVLDVLEKSTEASVSFQPYLWPGYEALHANPRFLAVLRRFGLPSPAGS